MMPEQYQFNYLTSISNYHLYEGRGVTGTSNVEHNGWVGFLFQKDIKGNPIKTLSLSESWKDYSGKPIENKQGGCYVFCRQAPVNKNVFLDVISTLLKKLSNDELFAYRYFLWIDNPNDSNESDLIYNLLPFVSDVNKDPLSGKVVHQKHSSLRNNSISFGNIYLKLPRNTIINVELESSSFEFKQFDNQLGLWNANGATQFGYIYKKITLSMTENSAAALIFTARFDTKSVNGNDFSKMQAGIRYFINDTDKKKTSQHYPVFDEGNGSSTYLIRVSLNPLWIEDHEQTYFQFIQDDSQDNKIDSFSSFFATTYGHALSLKPIPSSSKLVLMAGLLNSESKPRNETNLFYISPAGDFVISNIEKPVNAAKNSVLLCGLNGTETFSFTLESVDASNATILRFVADQPAYAPNFPFSPASPVGAPVDPSALLLNDTLKTSWVSLLSKNTEATSQYVSLPKGAALYGMDKLINSSKFLGFINPSSEITLSGGFSFPMIPYHGLFSNNNFSAENNSTLWSTEQIENFERQIISPTRRVKISGSMPKLKSPESVVVNNDSETINSTTPSGLIVNINKTSGAWTNITLGKLTTPVESSMYFSEPGAKLQQAFQTSDLMLVVANPENLGELAGNQGSTFANSLNIENWVLKAQVGDNYSYGDYSNIVIVKSLKGKLYDPQSTNTSLVNNPKKWTQSADFSAPNGKQNELVALSNWLADYFENAAIKTDDDKLYFERFNQIAQDENWTGILVLRANIDSLPPNIKGMVAGVKDMSAFNAHHFGIEISQTKIGDDGPELKGSSSAFGLIYYNDPDWDSSKPEIPVAPQAGSSYDFRLLGLKVLFENSAVKYFQSYAQLTLNELFGSKVSQMGEDGDGGNIYNSIILRGSFQDNEGIPVYGLSTIKDYVFIMDNNVFNKIEIASAQMATLNATESETEIWFGLTGYLDFKIVEQGSGEDALKVDLFSFGSKSGNTLREGLYFSNMGLAMNYPTATPDQKTFDFDSQNIRFDIQSSTIRKNSLYQSFALEIDSLTTGNKETAPTKKGFLNIITDLRLTGVDGENWHGLKFRLNLGSPGELAGKVGLNAELLIAWSNQGGKDNDYKINVGLHLPGTTNGASLISLQNVLKLSFGSIRLIYAKQSDQSDERNFMLMLTGIAIKFLGLAKIPPNGNTLFYLFGNPESNGKSSGLGWYAKYSKEHGMEDDEFSSTSLGSNVNKRID